MEDKELTIYLSGPMTGYKDYNYPKFERVTSQLKEKGYNIVNPSSGVMPMLIGGEEITVEELHKRVDEKTITDLEAWAVFMRGDIAKLVKDCNAIYLLKGWKGSKGARAEMSMAKTFKMKVFVEGDLL